MRREDCDGLGPRAALEDPSLVRRTSAEHYRDSVLAVEATPGAARSAGLFRSGPNVLVRVIEHRGPSANQHYTSLGIKAAGNLVCEETGPGRRMLPSAGPCSQVVRVGLVHRVTAKDPLPTRDVEILAWVDAALPPIDTYPTRELSGRPAHRQRCCTPRRRRRTRPQPRQAADSPTYRAAVTVAAAAAATHAEPAAGARAMAFGKAPGLAHDETPPHVIRCRRPTTQPSARL